MLITGFGSNARARSPGLALLIYSRDWSLLNRHVFQFTEDLKLSHPEQVIEPVLDQLKLSILCGSALIMVGVPGRSKGCNTCRKRRVKCGKSFPETNENPPTNLEINVWILFEVPRVALVVLFGSLPSLIHPR